VSAVALPRPARRSWWLEEALALPEFAGPEAPPLAGEVAADVVILGGGYTGMWSAWFLKERQPDLDVVILEADICGGGPSGRNGGFVNGQYDEADILIERHGDEGRRTVELFARAIDEVGAWCDANGVDAWYERPGQLGFSTNPSHDAKAVRTVEWARELGYGDVYEPLTKEQLRARFDSPVVRTAFRVTHGGTVQPARLARGLRNALLARGVRIFEGAPVLRFNAATATAQTPGGTVRAHRAIIGLNAWARSWRAFRRLLLIRGTYIAITAPAPEALERMHWTGGEGVYDMLAALHYVRPTRDGRVAFGGAGYRASGGRADHQQYRFHGRSVAMLVRDLRRWLPAFDGVPVEAAWGGPVDVSALYLPFFGTLPGGRTHYGLGFTGNGVGPCHVAGKILSGLALEIEDEATTLPVCDGDRKRFPPEPLFTPGEWIVSRSIIRRDQRLDAGRRPGVLTDLLARLPRCLGYNLGP
jgi:glycine/D-amino acid oxidase-like deaminating enzyme